MPWSIAAVPRHDPGQSQRRLDRAKRSRNELASLHRSISSRHELRPTASLLLLLNQLIACGRQGPAGRSGSHSRPGSEGVRAALYASFVGATEPNWVHPHTGDLGAAEGPNSGGEYAVKVGPASRRRQAAVPSCRATASLIQPLSGFASAAEREEDRVRGVERTPSPVASRTRSSRRRGEGHGRVREGECES